MKGQVASPAIGRAEKRRPAAFEPAVAGFAAGRPRVILNMAMTADGKIATANREVSSFGSRRDHEHLLDLRATADAVLCGASTAAGENISLGPGPARFRRKRLRRGLAEYNLRVVASGSARLHPNSSVFQHRFSPLIVLVTAGAPASRRKRLQTAANSVAIFGQRDLDLPAALAWLRRHWKVRRLICEGGGQLNDAMFRAGLVDEVHLTICPRVFGGRAAPTISEGAGFDTLKEARHWRLRSRRVVEGELYLVYDAVPAPSRVSTQRAMSHKRSDKRLK